MGYANRKSERNAEILRRKLRGESYVKISKSMDVSYPRVVDVAQKEFARVWDLWSSEKKTSEDLAEEYSLTISEVAEVLARESSKEEGRKAHQEYEQQLRNAEEEEYYASFNRLDIEDHWMNISECPSTLRHALLFDGISVFIGARVSSKAPWMFDEETVTPLYWMRIPGPPKEWKQC